MADDAHPARAFGPSKENLPPQVPAAPNNSKDCKALTVLFVALTVLFVALTVLFVALTVLFVPKSLDRRHRDGG